MGSRSFHTFSPPQPASRSVFFRAQGWRKTCRYLQQGRSISQCHAEERTVAVKRRVVMTKCEITLFWVGQPLSLSSLTGRSTQDWTAFVTSNPEVALDLPAVVISSRQRSRGRPTYSPPITTPLFPRRGPWRHGRRIAGGRKIFVRRDSVFRRGTTA